MFLATFTIALEFEALEAYAWKNGIDLIHPNQQCFYL